MSAINLNGPEFRRPLNGAGVLRISVRAKRLNIAKEVSNIGTWNVRGLKTAGKLAIVEKEMKRHGLAILGLSETHYDTIGEFTSSEGNFVFSSGKGGHTGVAVIVDGRYKNLVIGARAINDRLAVVRMDVTPHVMSIIQAYAPTSAAPDEEMDEFYGALEETLASIPRSDVTIVMGDFNAKVGKTDKSDGFYGLVGNHGLGTRNERGERLLQFCAEQQLVLTNTLFQQHRRRLYTWKSCDSHTRNQIDYILIQKRWKSSVIKARTYPGADASSDHQLLVARMKLRIRTKKMKKKARIFLKDSELKRVAAETKFKYSDTEDPNVMWEEIKAEVDQARQIVISDRKPGQEKRQPWITEDTLDVIEQRRQAKGRDHEQYRALNKEVRKCCRRDREAYLNQTCDEIQEHADRNETSTVFKKIRQITRDFKPRTREIKRDDGTIVWDSQGILDSWKEYCERLYQDEGAGEPGDPVPTIEVTGEDEPEILLDEVREAVKALRKRKAPGCDGIEAEVWQALGEKGTRIMWRLCRSIWKRKKWPAQWCRSVLIPLHKKGDARLCSNYRTIALIPHASKVMLRIINNRLKAYLHRQIPPEQAGFMPGRGTREQIMNVRQIIEKCREFNIPAVLCFIDYAKAFDCVKWKELYEVLREMGVPSHLVNMVESLYGDNTMVVKMDGEESSDFRAGQGVRQGCILSPLLFNIYGERIIREALENWSGGISIGGRKISNLRYADDTTLIAADEEEMAEMIDRVKTVSERLGLRINTAKTKVMVIDRAQSLPDSTALGEYEKVNTFVYLGSTVDANGGSSAEIRRRIALGKSAMTRLRNVTCNRIISRKTRKRLIKSLVFSVFLYASETWTLKADDKRRIDAFEMWVWRRMLRIPWTAKRTNASIVKELDEPVRLSAICESRILGYFGHVIRREDGNLEKDVLLGKPPGKSGRGRSPTRWTDGIRAQMGSVVSAAAETQDRERWCALVGAVRSQAAETQ